MKNMKAILEKKVYPSGKYYDLQRATVETAAPSARQLSK